MPTVDISDIILAHGRKGINELYVWLEKHISERYRISCEDPVISMGLGWEIRTYRFDTTEGVASGWVLDIEDEKLFTLYCLMKR